MQIAQANCGSSSNQNTNDLPIAAASLIEGHPKTHTDQASHQAPELPLSANDAAFRVEGQFLPALPAAALLDALWRSSDLHHQIGVMDRKSGHFRNLPVNTVAAAVEQGIEHSATGTDAYFACAEYSDPANRKADNVACAWAFWADFDCGPEKAAAGKGYEHIDQVYTALINFSNLTGLPAPTHLVNSGGGLHAYWVLDEPMQRGVWIDHARKFKATAKACGLLADPSRTADIASVLRLPGTLNHKYAPPRPVTLAKATKQFIAQDMMLQGISEP